MQGEGAYPLGVAYCSFSLQGTGALAQGVFRSENNVAIRCGLWGKSAVARAGGEVAGEFSPISCAPCAPAVLNQRTVVAFAAIYSTY